MDLPGSMNAIINAKSDTPFDMIDKSYSYVHGIEGFSTMKKSAKNGIIRFTLLIPFFQSISYVQFRE